MPSGEADTSRYIDKPLRGIIAEQPSTSNDHRYLIFADNDSPFYLRSIAIHLLLESLSNYLSKVDLGTRQYIENYVLTYPNRRLVDVSAKDHMNIELNGQWIDGIISKVDGSLIRVYLPILNKHEWLYRGSLHLQPLFNSLSSYEPSCKRFASDKQLKLTDKKCHFLLIPLNYGWKRQIRNDLGTIVYISPCGQMFTDGDRLFTYLYQNNSCLTIGQFTFDMNCRVTQKYLSPNNAFVNFDDYSSSKEKVPLMLVNEIDSTLPKPFEYTIERLAYTSDIQINKEHIQGCSCIDGCFDTTKCACWQKTYDGIIHSHYYEDLISSLKDLFEQTLDEQIDDRDELNLQLKEFLYESLSKRNFGYKHGRLLEKIHSGIYECNSKCQCDIRCTNRCVQFGLNTLLQIFNTSDKGWGVRTLYDLPAGTFLSFYAGEILNDEDANKRGLEKTMGDVYFTALDFVTSLQKKSNHETGIYVMDAHFKGNVSRFYNHSCSPNVFVQNVFIDTWDVRFPWVAFFTSTHVKAGTELVWDYSYEVDTVENRVLHCRCGSDECRHRLL